jgi:hypothetical protein
MEEGKVTDGRPIKLINPWISNILTIIGMALGWFIINYIRTRSVETAIVDAALFILFLLAANVILFLLKKRTFLLRF